MHEVRNFIRFRDANFPGKPIYLTEWGWDSDGAGETASGSESVSERAQALYAIRGAMMFARQGKKKFLCPYYLHVILTLVAIQS